MAKQHKGAKPNEKEARLIEAAKEFLQYFPKEVRGFVSYDGTVFMNHEKQIAVQYAEANNQLFYEYDVASGKLNEVITNKES